MYHSGARLALAFTFLAVTAAWAAESATSALDRVVVVKIEAQALSSALIEFSKQAGVQVVTPAEKVSKLRSQAVNGQMAVSDALARLLAGTHLDFHAAGANTIGLEVRKAAGADLAAPNGGELSLRLAKTQVEDESVNARSGSSAAEAQRPGSASAAEDKGVPEILVRGSRSLNSDIRRTEDDIQPYVVFDREEIERSQAVNLQEFLATRLPMSSADTSQVQNNPGTALTFSSINLRGLGENQTLILVDGRRMPGIAQGGNPRQPDLNGIPLGAIERIEVLPSTAGGTYGGSATGGVINVILRRDYRGLEGKVTYANTFDSDAANRRLEINGGFNLGERTQLTVAGTYSSGNVLTVGDRDLTARGIALQRKNNPVAFATSASPPLGGTVNIHSAEAGVPLTLKQAYGGAALGSTYTHVPLGYAGPASDSGRALVDNAGTYNLDLPPGMAGKDRSLVASPSMESASLNLRHEFSERVQAFLDVSRFGNRGRSYSASVPSSVSGLAATAPNNPFVQAINVTFPVPNYVFESRSESTTERASVGLIAGLTRGWSAGFDYGWSRSRLENIASSSVVDSAVPTRTGLPAADGRPAINVLQEGNTYPLDFSAYLLPTPNSFFGPNDMIMRNAALRLSGPAATLPGGTLDLLATAEWRDEEFKDAFQQDINATTRLPTYTLYPHKTQTNNAYYVEARAPLVSPVNARPGVRALELQASVRQENNRMSSFPGTSRSIPSPDGPFPLITYTTARQSSSDFSVGLRYAPTGDLALRTSFNTGFLPPSVTQIAPQISTVTTGLSDPKRPTDSYAGRAYVFTTSGNADLAPEESESWSAGLILTPRALPGLRLAVDYTRIDKDNEIRTPAIAYLISNEEAYPERVVRGQRLASDPPDWPGPITSLDVSLLNVSKTSLEACDIQLDYSVATQRSGEFRGYAIATRSMHYTNQTRPIDPVVEYVDFSVGKLKWRGNLGIDWKRGALAVGWNAQYYGSYLGYPADAPQFIIDSFVLSQGSARIPHQIYHDLVATYRIDDRTGGFLGGVEFSAGIQNLFNTYPPALAISSPLGVGYSTLGDPRLRRYTLSLRKAFGLNGRPS